MESLSDSLQYSNSDSKFTSVNYSDSHNSTVTVVFKNLTDLIPDDEYTPFYVSKFKSLGYNRFMELANKARGGKEPARLFFWMLKHNEIVR